MKQKDRHQTLPKLFAAPRWTESHDHDSKNDNGVDNGMFPFLTDAEKFCSCHSERHKSKY
jgi:hypothetical protein